ncbi:MAG: helix-turn-helix transcriptional regulator [Burkholderiales bacterium]|nr:helix-turn-helix transcriptional regulator [Burkholderiales bacterium]MBH2017621.1 helix-turn-helix transcriptional regulator [Burkholderiales bacterium]
MDTRPPLSSPPATPPAVSLCEGRLLLDARRLKHGRQCLGLSQEALAELCQGRHLCASIASIKRAEAGKPVLYRTARHLADAIGVPLAELIRRG